MRRMLTDQTVAAMRSRLGRALAPPRGRYRPFWVERAAVGWVDDARAARLALHDRRLRRARRRRVVCCGRSRRSRPQRGAPTRGSHAGRGRPPHGVARRTLRGRAGIRGPTVVPARARCGAVLRNPHLRGARERRRPRRRWRPDVAGPPQSREVDRPRHARQPDRRRNRRRAVGRGDRRQGSVGGSRRRRAARRSRATGGHRAHVPRAAGRPAARDDLRARPVAGRGLHAVRPGRRGGRPPARRVARGGAIDRRRRRSRRRHRRREPRHPGLPASATETSRPMRRAMWRSTRCAIRRASLQNPRRRDRRVPKSSGNTRDFTWPAA